MPDWTEDHSDVHSQQELAALAQWQVEQNRLAKARLDEELRRASAQRQAEDARRAAVRTERNTKAVRAIRNAPMYIEELWTLLVLAVILWVLAGGLIYLVIAISAGEDFFSQNESFSVALFGVVGVGSLIGAWKGR